MKGLILAAGEGKRMAEMKLKHKSFAEIRKKHVIDYSLDLLAEQKEYISEIVIVVGYHADDIIEYVGENYCGIPVKYAFQNERLGIAHAIKTASELLRDNFILCLADEILFNPRLGRMINCFIQTEADCVCGIIKSDSDMSFKPIAYDLDDDKNINNVREKPDYYTNDIRGVGECIFGFRSLEILERLMPNKVRGEYEMGDWIQLVIDEGGKAITFEIADTYVNVNRAKDIVLANEMFEMNEESK